MASFKFLIAYSMSQLLVNIIISTCLYLLISLSFCSTYSTLRFFNLVHANSLTIGPYLVFMLVIMWNMSLWIAVPIAISIVVLLMLAICEWIYKPLQKRGAVSWQLMIISLGLYEVFQNLISLIWGDRTLSFRTWEIREGYVILGAHISNIQLLSILLCTFLLLISWMFLEMTILGKRINAVSSNPELSMILGISKDRVILWSISFGTGLAACAGIMIAADTDMKPTMGFNWLLYAVVAMIVGGGGKIRNLLFGSLLLATTQHLIAYSIDSKWMNAVAYLILIIFLYVEPYGFSGKQIKKSSI